MKKLKILYVDEANNTGERKLKQGIKDRGQVSNEEC